MCSWGVDDDGDDDDGDAPERSVCSAPLPDSCVSCSPALAARSGIRAVFMLRRLAQLCSLEPSFPCSHADTRMHYAVHSEENARPLFCAEVKVREKKKRGGNGSG